MSVTLVEVQGSLLLKHCVINCGLLSTILVKNICDQTSILITFLGARHSVDSTRFRLAKCDLTSEAEKLGGTWKKRAQVFSKITNCSENTRISSARIFIMIESEFSLPRAACLSHLKSFVLHRDLDLPECQEKGKKEKADSPRTEA